MKHWPLTRTKLKEWTQVVIPCRSWLSSSASPSLGLCTVTTLVNCLTPVPACISMPMTLHTSALSLLPPPWSSVDFHSDVASFEETRTACCTPQSFHSCFCRVSVTAITEWHRQLLETPSLTETEAPRGHKTTQVCGCLALFPALGKRPIPPLTLLPLLETFSFPTVSPPPL